MVHKRRIGPLELKASDVEQKMRRCGVPARYLKSTEESIGRLFSFTVERPWAKDEELGRYNVTYQQKIVRSLFEEEALRKTSDIIGVGSYPTDQLGMVFGAAVCRRALAMGLNPLMLGLWNSPERTPIAEEPDVVVLYSIRPDSHSVRFEMCRHWMSDFGDTFIVVIVGVFGDTFQVPFFQYWPIVLLGGLVLFLVLQLAPRLFFKPNGERDA